MTAGAAQAEGVQVVRDHFRDYSASGTVTLRGRGMRVRTIAATRGHRPRALHPDTTTDDIAELAAAINSTRAFLHQT